MSTHILANLWKYLLFIYLHNLLLLPPLMLTQQPHSVTCYTEWILGFVLGEQKTNTPPPKKKHTVVHVKMLKLFKGNNSVFISYLIFYAYDAPYFIAISPRFFLLCSYLIQDAHKGVFMSVAVIQSRNLLQTES